MQRVHVKFQAGTHTTPQWRLAGDTCFQHDKKNAARPFEVLRGSFNEQEYTGEVEI